MTLKIERLAADESVSITPSGRIQVERLSELEKLLALEASDRSVVLDLEEVRLVDREVVMFLARCEADGATLDHQRVESLRRAGPPPPGLQPVADLDPRGSNGQQVCAH